MTQDLVPVYFPVPEWASHPPLWMTEATDDPLPLQFPTPLPLPHQVVCSALWWLQPVRSYVEAERDCLHRAADLAGKLDLANSREQAGQLQQAGRYRAWHRHWHGHSVSGISEL